MRKAVVIPSYRAEKTLRSVVETLPEEIRSEGGIIIVNDASPDATGTIADELAASSPNIHALGHARNRGYGGALKTGLRWGCEHGFDILAVVHSDGQYAPDLVLTLCQPIETGLSEIVQGSRMLGGARSGRNPMPMSRYLPNRILTALENLTFGTEMAEFHSGYMIYSRRLLEQVPFERLQDNYNFDAEMIIMAHLLGIRCAEVPIPTRYDDETSSLRPIPYGINVLKMMWKFSTGHYRQLLDEHEARAGTPSPRSSAAPG